MKNYFQIIQKFSSLMTLYSHRYKSRKALLKLSNSQLNDIGLSRSQAIKEASKAFWIGDNTLLTKRDQRCMTNKKTSMKYSYDRKKCNQTFAT